MQAVLHSGDGGTSELSLSRFEYALPPELIAQAPAPRRDAARLLVLDRSVGAIRHRVVRDLPSLLRRGDLLVFNDTRVLPARLRGRTAAGGAVEVLLCAEQDAGLWLCLGKPAKRLRTGSELWFAADASAHVGDVRGGGWYTLRFADGVDVQALLAQHGELPLPPYIKRGPGTLAADAERYQTVFASRDGAVAAPTAGLHFTQPLLDSLRHAGVELAWLTLHVGPGTFLPVRYEDVRRHRIDAEAAWIPETTALAVQAAKRDGRRVVAVGTTTTRALESAAAQWGAVREGHLWADAFILPGFRFRVVDALITNFHLPRSTLLLLVCAFAGRTRLLDAYEVAVRERYRFYSYGDAMLVV